MVPDDGEPFFFPGHDIYRNFNVHFTFRGSERNENRCSGADRDGRIGCDQLDGCKIYCPMNGLVYLKNVVTLELDQVKCNGCRMCTIVCPHDVFAIENRKAMIRNKDLCMECGACEKNCAEGAITVRSGVGCAAGIINGLIRGTEPSCDCGSEGSTCC
jgi:NAD-dependent dihydropyrimidine dehydrogenase PreA subunit